MIGLCLFGGEIAIGNPELAASANGVGFYFMARTLLTLYRQLNTMIVHWIRVQLLPGEIHRIARPY